jgi:murein lipoprotein
MRGYDSGKNPLQGCNISDVPDERRSGMNINKNHLATARTVVVALVAGLSLAGCASYKEEFATINSRLDSLDTKVNSAAQSADQANQSAQQANQRLDQIEGRLQRLESQPATTKRQPRG